MAFIDFVIALSALLGSLLLPFAGLYWMLRLRRRRAAVVVPVPVAVRSAAPGPVK